MPLCAVVRINRHSANLHPSGFCRAFPSFPFPSLSPSHPILSVFLTRHLPYPQLAYCAAVIALSESTQVSCYAIPSPPPPPPHARGGGGRPRMSHSGHVLVRSKKRPQSTLWRQAGRFGPSHSRLPSLPFFCLCSQGACRICSRRSSLL